MDSTNRFSQRMTWLLGLSTENWKLDAIIIWYSSFSWTVEISRTCSEMHRYVQCFILTVHFGKSKFQRKFILKLHFRLKLDCTGCTLCRLDFAMHRASYSRKCMPSNHMVMAVDLCKLGRHKNLLPCFAWQNLTCTVCALPTTETWSSP